MLGIGFRDGLFSVLEPLDKTLSSTATYNARGAVGQKQT